VRTASDTGLAEIIVTATRRSNPYRMSPPGYCLDRQRLDQMNARNFDDFAGFVPGLSYASTGASTISL